ncbi:hypothetical protein WP8W19C03_14670 [Aeromonas veronii]|nr:hypothetical protein WP8W19C03_14670 [Aeromonas veronii]
MRFYTGLTLAVVALIAVFVKLQMRGKADK